MLGAFRLIFALRLTDFEHFERDFEGDEEGCFVPTVQLSPGNSC